MCDIASFISEANMTYFVNKMTQPSCVETLVDGLKKLLPLVTGLLNVKRQLIEICDVVTNLRLVKEPVEMSID